MYIYYLYSGFDRRQEECCQRRHRRVGPLPRHARHRHPVEPGEGGLPPGAPVLHQPSRSQAQAAGLPGRHQVGQAPLHQPHRDEPGAQQDHRRWVGGGSV